jgi:hypothetical protein
MTHQAQAKMTPCVVPTLTPMISQQAMPPWAIPTPEIWDRVPVNDGCFDQEKAPVGPVISKDFLRSVCAPFFDQMLVAVQQSVQDQSQQRFVHEHGASWQSLAPPSMRDKGQDSVTQDTDPTAATLSRQSTFEGSDAVSECAAFSCLLAPLSNPVVPEKDLVDETNSHAKANEDSENDEVPWDQCWCPSSETVFSEGSEVPRLKISNRELRTQTMVCRHWRSKGWCRMEGACKFLHPEQKCGVSMTNGNLGGTSGNANTSGTVAHTGISSDQPLAMTMEGKKKAGNGKKRRNKGKPNLLQESQFHLGRVQDAQFAGVVQ